MLVSPGIPTGKPDSRGVASGGALGVLRSQLCLCPQAAWHVSPPARVDTEEAPSLTQRAGPWSWPCSHRTMRTKFPLFLIHAGWPVLLQQPTWTWTSGQWANQIKKHPVQTKGASAPAGRASWPLSVAPVSCSNCCLLPAPWVNRAGAEQDTGLSACDRVALSQTPEPCPHGGFKQGSGNGH